MVNIKHLAETSGARDSYPALSLSVLRTFHPFPSLVSTLLGLASIESPSQNMDTERQSRQFNQPSLHLVSNPTPAQPISTRVQNHKHSESPFRYLTERLVSEQVFSEKDQTALADISSSSGRRASSTSRATHRSSPSNSRSSTPAPSQHRAHSKQPSQHARPAAPNPLLTAVDNGGGRPCRRVGQLERSRWCMLATRLRPWIPVIIYGISSLGFVVGIAFWRTEIFQGTAMRCTLHVTADLELFLGLDNLSHRLQEEGSYGYCVIFLLIWVTTFRESRANRRSGIFRSRLRRCAAPLPLYSTFITLSGYTYGAWMGAIISYFAALSGAICVYALCRAFFRETIASWLSKTTTIQRVVRAIEKRPKLLFMVRLAPYPYNVMNALLAASPTLTLKTYTLCTALSLFKVIIHTTIGASIHSFAGYHLHKTPSSGDGEDPAGDKSEDDEGALLSRISAVVGIVLCVAIIVYLSWVARRAVDDELEEDEAAPHSPEEAELFLDPLDDVERGMGEVRCSRPLVPMSNHDHVRTLASMSSVSVDDPWGRRQGAF